MQKVKLSLANMQGKLSRSEMKNIMAGSGDGDVNGCYKCCVGSNCSSCVTSYSTAKCPSGTLTSCTGC